MSSRPAPTGMTWARASAALATRVRRRFRLTAAFRQIGAALVVAAALALLWRAAGPQLAGVPGTLVVAGILLAGLLVGLVLAGRAARRAPKVDDVDAAWALDRLAPAHGRGLAAATAKGPAASEAAFGAGGLLAPPLVRLHPPGGLALVVGALLLSVLALLAPENTPPEDADGRAADGRLVAPGGDGTTSGADRAEGRARALQAEADAAREVRKALNLAPDGPLDPLEVAARLEDEQARRAAAEAAGTGSDLAEVLERPDTSGDAVARLIGRGEDNRSAAARARRDAAGIRARSGVPAVPPGRRAVVARYLQLIDRNASSRR